MARSEESNFGHAELILTLSLASLLVVIASYFTEKRKTEENFHKPPLSNLLTYKH